MTCWYSLVFPLHVKQDETISNSIRRHGGFPDLDLVHLVAGWSKTSGSGKDITDMTCGYSLVFPLYVEKDETISNLIRRHGGLPDLNLVHLDAGWGKTSGSGQRRHRYGIWVLSDLPSSPTTRFDNLLLDMRSQAPRPWWSCTSWCWLGQDFRIRTKTSQIWHVGTLWPSLVTDNKIWQFITWYEVAGSSTLMILYILMLVGARLPDPDQDVTDMACGYSLIFPRHGEQDDTSLILIWVSDSLPDLAVAEHLDLEVGQKQPGILDQLYASPYPLLRTVLVDAGHSVHSASASWVWTKE